MFGQSYTCPSCKRTGPVRLARGAVCAECESKRQWTQFAKGGIVIRLDDQESKESLTSPAAPRSRAKNPFTDRMLVATLVPCATGGVFLALYFFARHVGSPVHVLQRVRWELLTAGICGGIALVIAAIIHPSLRGSGSRTWRSSIFAAICFMGGGISVFSLINMFLTPGPPTIPKSNGENKTAGDSTALIYLNGPDGTFRAPTVGIGVLVSSDADRGVVLTDRETVLLAREKLTEGSPALENRVWVMFSNGRGAEGTVLLPEILPELAMIQVKSTALPHAASLDPLAGAVIPGETVYSSSSSFEQNHRAKEGVVLNESRRPVHGLPCGLLYIGLPPDFVEKGSGIFSRTQLLIGLGVGYDPSDGTTRVLSLSEGLLHSLLVKSAVTSPPTSQPTSTQ